jgi:H+/Cl- antiporter ClcA
MLLSAQKWKVRIVFWSSAVAIGAVAAGFAEGADYANQLFTRITDISPYLPLVLCPAVLLLVAWITRRFFPGSEGSGIPQAIAALSMPDDTARSKVLSVRIAFGKILLTLMGLMSGASIGREGPTVHIGASVLFAIRRLAPFPRHDIERGLILAGGAAGISAAFNTPIAGILFAIEEMSRSFEERSSGTVIIAVIVSGLIALVVLGNYTYFGTTDAQLGDVSSWLAVPVCGIAGGALGGLFSQGLILGTQHMPAIFRKRPYLLAITCGVVIALIGLVSGGSTYGTGYEQAKAVVTGTGTLDPLYPIWKLLATVVSYLSGIPGGIFAPSLATGAGLGANLAAWFPSAPAAAIVILAMVSYFSGVVQTPITAFVIVMEMTGNQSMLLPLMAASFIAYGTSTIICPQPVYRALAKAFHQKQQEPEPVPAPPSNSG